MHNLLFYDLTLWLNNLTVTFLLVRQLLMQNSKAIVVCAPSRPKTEQKHKTKDFAEIHNQILLLTMFLLLFLFTIVITKKRYILKVCEPILLKLNRELGQWWKCNKAVFGLIDCASLRCYELPKLRFCKT